MMKANDKAYAAARKVAYNRINKCFVFDLIKEAVDAAYAAQFQSDAPNALKKAWICYRLCEGGGAYDGPFFVKYEPEEGDYDKIEPILYYDAAQFPPSEDYAELIETLRSSSPYTLSHVAADALEAVLAERDELDKWLRESKQNFMRVDIERNNLRTERDALLARLAPVDDEALETIAARAIVKENVYKETQIPSKTLARAAIAAIRPHIEAAERERCAKIAEKYENERANYLLDRSARAVATLWREEIAAAIRSGK